MDVRRAPGRRGSRPALSGAELPSGRGQNFGYSRKPGFEMSIYPYHQIRLLQPAHVRGFEREVMRRSMAIDNQAWFGDAGHNCGGDFVNRCNRSHHARRGGQRGAVEA